MADFPPARGLSDRSLPKIGPSELPPPVTLHLEDFGGKADNGTTDNLAPFLAARSTFTNAVGARLGLGRIVLGAGVYAFSDTLRIDRPILLEGQGAGARPATIIQVPDAKCGIAVDYTAPFSYAGGFGGNGSKLRDFGVIGVGRSNPQAHGIVVRYTCVLEGLNINNFGGDGVNIDANVGFGANATFWSARDLVINNVLNGFMAGGGNGSAGVAVQVVCNNTDLWGFVDIGSSGQNRYLGCGTDVSTNRLGVTTDLRSGGGTNDGFKTRSVIVKDIAIGDTTIWIPQGDAPSLPAAGVILVDNEWISYTSITQNVGTVNPVPVYNPSTLLTYATLNGCGRAALGTVAAAHACEPFGNGVLTYFYWPEGVDPYIGGGGIRDSHYYESNRALFSRSGSYSIFPNGNDPLSGWFGRARLSTAALVGDTTLHVVSTDGLPASATIRYGTEQMSYTSLTAGRPGTLNGVTRGVNGTTAGPIGQYEQLQWQFGSPLGRGPVKIGDQSDIVEVPFDFQANGSAYWTPTLDMVWLKQGTVNGNGSGEATVTAKIDGTTVAVGAVVRAGHEYSVTVAGLTGAHRVSLTHQFVVQNDNWSSVR